MKKILTNKYKEAANYDDQQNYFEPRHQKGQGASIYTEDNVDNEEDINRQWKKRKPKKK